MMFSPAVRIFVAAQPTDLRHSFDALAEMARRVLGQDPFSGHLFVYFNRARNRVKVLGRDRTGFCLWHKRLEEGTFRVPEEGATAVEMEAAELALILEGIDLAGARQRRRYRRPGALHAQ